MEFKFEMNNRSWVIKEVDQITIKEIIRDYDGKVDDEGQYFGTTLTKYQEIFIDKSLCEQQMRQTLMHELMHVYITCYLFDLSTVSDEVLCNISACSHDLIHSIVEEYFKARFKYNFNKTMEETKKVEVLKNE